MERAYFVQGYKARQCLFY